MTQENMDWSDTSATAGNDGPEVEQIVVEIEQTRDEMTGTVEAIGDRLDPRNIVQGAKETVRDATVGKVEQMASSASEMASQAGSTVQQAGGGIVETIRRNPVPAAMAGIGLGWLVMSARSSGRAWKGSAWNGGRTDRWSGDAWPNTDRAHGRGAYAAYADGESTGAGIGDRIGGTASDAAHNVQRTASDVADNVSRTASDAFDAARGTVGQVPDQVGGVARQVGDNAGRIVEDNPLAVGAVALAIGAAIGMALPTTRTEQQLLRQPARQAIDTASQAVQQPMQEMERQASQG